MLESLHYDKDYHLPYNNLVNINRNLIEIKIRIGVFYKEYRNISFNGMKDTDTQMIQEYIDKTIKKIRQVEKLIRRQEECL